MTKILSEIRAKSYKTENGSKKSLLRADGSVIDISNFVDVGAFIRAATGESEVLSATSGWFSVVVGRYVLPSSMTSDLFAGGVNLATLLSETLGYRITLMTDEVDLSKYGKGFANIVSSLRKSKYSVYIENDVESLVSNGEIVVFKLTVEQMKVIIECFRRIA